MFSAIWWVLSCTVTYIQKIKNYLIWEKSTLAILYRKNVSWEVQKALAIKIMTSAMTELDEGILDAAKFAAATTGFPKKLYADGHTHISLH